MNTRTFFRGETVLCLAAALCAGALWASTSYAGDTPVKFSYEGTGHDLGVDLNDDGLMLGITYAQIRGSIFGTGMLTITSEFAVDPEVECEVGYMPLTLFQSTIIVTTDAGDQVFGFGNGGDACLNLDTGHMYGDAYGVYQGGTGRFATATGEYYTEYTVYNVEPFTGSGLRAIQGTVEGTLSR
jgi:hypothetical protein